MADATNTSGLTAESPEAQWLPPPDPMAPDAVAADRTRWSQRERDAFEGREMRLLRESLLLPGSDDVRDSILDDLSTFYGMKKEDCVRRAINWREWAFEEWSASDRATRSELTDFYETIQSMSFGVIWHRYLEVEGFVWPSTAMIAGSVPRPTPGMRHLDFGSGVGVMSQLMSKLGYETDLADIATSMLEFARFRLERRSVEANYINLTTTAVAQDRYDVITAIDTLAHVPDVEETANTLHAALKPGGLLVANFDVRQQSPATAWHLYDDDTNLRWRVHRAGFEPVQRIGGKAVYVYRRVEPRGLGRHTRSLRDLVLLRSPLRPAYRALRWNARQLLRQG